jgi:NAD+ synthase
MSDTLRIALAQLNQTVGDPPGNLKKITAAYQTAARAGADLVLTPELSISYYQPEDLVLRPAYTEACMAKAEELAAITRDGPALIVGSPWKNTKGLDQKPYNAAILMRGGRIEQVWYKYDLPNYLVFDDKRIFAAGGKDDGEPFLIKGVRVGIAICEDMWSKDRAAAMKLRGAQLLVVPNASPFETDKQPIRRAVITARIRETGLPVVYVNQVGGQDSVVYDGGSFVMNAECEITSYLGTFEEKIAVVTFKKTGERWLPQPTELAPFYSEDEMIYQALLQGLRDYVQKNNFPGVVIGMSGGIDSAFVAALAVDALGKDKVMTVMMPSPYTSKESLEDAQKASQMLGCEYKIIPIEQAMNIVGAGLKEHVKGLNTDVMDQNIQSRLRGLILMALSNSHGHMVLATGNKSEMATGYATLYGDMCGGYAPIKDVYKNIIFRLSRWRNVTRPKNALGPAGFVMPDRIITRPPSAELKPGQVDQDTLPPYEQLDDILQCLIERELSVAEITSRGHHEDVVRKVLRMLRLSEYKRHQSPPGTKITSRAFGRDRRYPITNRFIE